jgi:hypothetical protein
MLVVSVWPSSHWDGSLKSSLKIMSPPDGFCNSSVGEIFSVGNGVGVSVGGNQITVAVGVAVGSDVAVVSGGSGVYSGMQPAKKITRSASNNDLTLKL